MLQQPPMKQNDFVDVLIESVHKYYDRLDENGQPTRILEPDNESLFWRTLLINHNGFGGAVLELKKWAGLMESAYDNMCPEVAQQLHDQGMRIYEGYKYAFASKSSETIRDRDNSQSSLTHLLLRDHMEKTVTLKDNMKKGGLQALGIGGRDNDDRPQ